MIAVIAGASGLVGNKLVQDLMIDPSFSLVIAVTRKPILLNNNKFKNIICDDFEKLELLSDELKGDIYFCCLGSTIKKSKTKENFRKVDYNAVINFAQVAKMHDALQFIVVSASGADPESSIFYNKTKGEVEKSLISMKLNSLVIFRPGLLLGSRQENRLAEKISIDLLNFLSPVIPQKIQKIISTKVDQLCESMIKESKHTRTPQKIIEAKDI